MIDLTIARPEPRARGRAARRIDAVEALEDARLVLRRDRRPLLDTSSVQAPSSCTVASIDTVVPSVAWRERVRHQIGDRAAQQRAIGPHAALSCAQPVADDVHPALLGERLEVVVQAIGVEAEFDPFALQRRALASSARARNSMFSIRREMRS